MLYHLKIRNNIKKFSLTTLSKKTSKTSFFQETLISWPYAKIEQTKVKTKQNVSQW
jgi:hypothetical protein